MIRPTETKSAIYAMQGLPHERKTARSERNQNTAVRAADLHETQHTRAPAFASRFCAAYGTQTSLRGRDAALRVVRAHGCKRTRIARTPKGASAEQRARWPHQQEALSRLGRITGGPANDRASRARVVRSHRRSRHRTLTTYA